MRESTYIDEEKLLGDDLVDELSNRLSTATLAAVIAVRLK